MSYLKLLLAILRGVYCFVDKVEGISHIRQSTINCTSWDIYGQKRDIYIRDNCVKISDITVLLKYVFTSMKLVVLCFKHMQKVKIFQHLASTRVPRFSETVAQKGYHVSNLPSAPLPQEISFSEVTLSPSIANCEDYFCWSAVVTKSFL